MITITNNNIYYSEFPISYLYSLDNVEKIKLGDVANFLSDDVELSESVTLKRLFDIIGANVAKFNEIFYSSLGGYPLEPFLQEIQNNPTDKVECEYLEIFWFSDKYEDELNIYPSLHGVSTKLDDGPYAIDFISLNNIKEHIVKINKSVKIYEYGKKTIEDIVLGNKTFNLFELFNAIFYEISFHGGPQDKKERFTEIETSLEEAEEQIKAGKLGSSTSFEDLLDKFENLDNYLVKYKKLSDRLEEDRIQNDKNIDKLKSCLLEKLKIYHTISHTKYKLKTHYKKLTDIEYNMQLLYGEKENIAYHRFWETPKCTCPKVDNLEIYPSNNPIFNSKCPIHKK